jgi:hypothetical protein
LLLEKTRANEEIGAWPAAALIFHLMATCLPRYTPDPSFCELVYTFIIKGDMTPAHPPKKDN